MVRGAAALGVLGISFAAIFVRLADVAPAEATLFRVGYAVPMLGVVWMATRRRDHRAVRARLIAVLAGLVFSIDLTLWHESIDRIGAGLGTVLANTQVIFVGVIAWVAYRERPAKVTVALIPVVLLGVVLLSGIDGAGYGDDPVGGVLYGVGAGLAYAVFIVVLRHANRMASAPAVGPLLDATAGAVLGALVLSIFDGSVSYTPSWPAHGWILLLAAVSQTFGWLLISVALPRLPALETSLLILIQPAAALIWARLIFDEALSGSQWLGVVIVLVGITLAAGRGPSRVTPPAAESPKSP